MSENTQQPKSLEDFENHYKEEMENGIEEIERNIEKEIPNEYEPLGVDGPTEADVELWKQQFPSAKIFKVTLSETIYILRTLNRVEYKMIVTREDLNALTREEVITKTCCLYPIIDSRILGEGDAGIPASLATLIMQVSGFEEPEEVQRIV